MTPAVPGTPRAGVPAPAEGPSASRLAPGVGVRPWRHHFAPWDLAAHVSLHDGVRQERGRLVPAGPARPATAEECALLDAAAAAQAPALEVFTTPDLLRDHFWSLDPDELPGGAAGTEPSKAWLGFAGDVREFLKQVRAPLTPAHALVLTVREAGSGELWTEGPGRTLLERDRGDGSVAVEAQMFAAHVNLGDEPTSAVFFNVPLAGMAALLKAEGATVPPRDGLALVKAFTERFPRCPLVRLALAPGEGVFVPLVGIAHDLVPAQGADLDVVLSVLPSPR
jgi:hypothetical protein